MKLIKKIGLLASLTTLFFMLGACSLPSVGKKEPTPTAIDPVAIFTSAAETVEAQLTETALSFSPTPELTSTATPTMLATATLIDLNKTPLPTLPGATATFLPGVPTFTPGAAPSLTPIATQDGVICDNMEFVADITIPDGSTIKPGYDFLKVWRIRNTGVCTWDDGYQLVLVQGGRILDSPNVPDWIKTNIAPGEVVDLGANLTAPLANGEYSSCFIMQNDRGVFFGTWICVEIVVKGN